MACESTTGISSTATTTGWPLPTSWLSKTKTNSKITSSATRIFSTSAQWSINRLYGPNNNTNRQRNHCIFGCSCWFCNWAPPTSTTETTSTDCIRSIEDTCWPDWIISAPGTTAKDWALSPEKLSKARSSRCSKYGRFSSLKWLKAKSVVNLASAAVLPKLCGKVYATIKDKTNRICWMYPRCRIVLFQNNLINLARKTILSIWRKVSATKLDLYWNWGIAMCRREGNLSPRSKVVPKWELQDLWPPLEEKAPVAAAK